MAQDKNVTIDVFPSMDAIAAGQSFDIAIRQNIREGWHTYWVNPGDSGEAMSITWQDIPNGIEISNIQEPTPYRIDYDPLVNFGHSGRPVFIQTITVNDDFKDESIILNGEAFWLVCADICIPESEKISLIMPVGNDGRAVNKDIFNAARSAMPTAVDWQTSLSKKDNDIILDVEVPAEFHNQMTDVEIFPYDWGVIQTTSAIIPDIRDDRVIFTAEAGDRDLNDLDVARFIIKTDIAAYDISTAVNGTIINDYGQSNSFLLIILFAFIGGLILNLMPCVFPVLSMKALSLVKLSDKEKSRMRASGLAYTAGIILSFLLIAGLLMLLKGAGETIGWGFQLQNPYVVTILATLLFLIGLNLFGVFEISGRFTAFGSSLTTGNDTKSSFYTGVLACLVATPCTAPFMASAIGYALTQPAIIGLSVFAVLGFGLAFPYLLLTYIPAVQKILPRPGAWMNIFKQALAFPMFASAIWLIWVLAQQAGDLSIIYILGLFTAILFVIWIYKITSSRFWRVGILALLFGLFIGYASILSPKNDMNYEPFDPVKLQQILTENPSQSVFVNMTAAWCITCLVNEQTSLSHSDVVKAFENSDILYMKGDWTNRDGDITKFLESYGRNGVPLYVYYQGANDTNVRPEPVLLPQILTPDIILNSIKILEKLNCVLLPFVLVLNCDILSLAKLFIA